MRILLVTNIISHHQLPLARNLVLLVGEENFRLVAVMQPDPERTKLGWNQDISEKWILRPYEASDQKKQYLKWLNDCDLLISGERIFDIFEERLKKGKLCFYFSERWFKPKLGKYRLFSIRYMRMVFKFKSLIGKYKQMRYLAIGPYAANDISFLLNKNEMSSVLKWGYFPQTSSLNPNENINVARVPNSILWCGRLLPWKNIEVILKATEFLFERGIRIQLNLVGDGPLREELYNKIEESPILNDFVKLMPSVAFDKINDLMRVSQVYVLASNEYEGWGAVINEAMSNGMLVVASYQTGAGLSLINHGVNGFVFNGEDYEDLASCLEYIFTSDHSLDSIQINSIKFINTEWSEEVAARRLVEYGNFLLSRDEDVLVYNDGPLSNINNWIERLKFQNSEKKSYPK